MFTIKETAANSIRLPTNEETCLVHGNDLHNYIHYTSYQTEKKTKKMKIKNSTKKKEIIAVKSTILFPTKWLQSSIRWIFSYCIRRSTFNVLTKLQAQVLYDTLRPFHVLQLSTEVSEINYLRSQGPIDSKWPLPPSLSCPFSVFVQFDLVFFCSHRLTPWLAAQKEKNENKEKKIINKSQWIW